VQFVVLAVAIAVVFYTTSIVQTLVIGIANALGVHPVISRQECSPVNLPAYTNIWRIEKRLYQPYDFRLPMPLPSNWIAVAAGTTIPYIVRLIVAGPPYDHTLVLLHVLPPGGAHLTDHQAHHREQAAA
jgi:hypothetical protein